MSDPKQKTLNLPIEGLESKNDTPIDKKPEASAETNRDDIINQAKAFLAQDDVQNESTDKKIAFLEKKGLTSDEIQSLLGISRNPEASSQPASIPKPDTPTQRAPSQAQQSPPPRDTPPIITYPEFLTTPLAPSPLVTTARLLTTLYLFSGLSALLYGTSTYLVHPMREQLTSSRISLHDTAAQNIARLVARLEDVVSEVPPPLRLHEESEDEDPTEMFHRDVGVQTSPPGTPTATRAKAAPAEEQADKLGRIRGSLEELLGSGGEEDDGVRRLGEAKAELEEYLVGLRYQVPRFGADFGYAGTGAKDGDEVASVKAGIRGLKGVLLSARSFPG